MKMSNLIRSLITVLAVVIFSCQTVDRNLQNGETWIEKIPGNYSGYLSSGGLDVPVITTFTKNEQGTINGSYDATERDVQVPGRLENCFAVGYGKMKCRWIDKYGKGDLEILFFNSMTRFKGHWSADGDENKFYWNGFKK